MNEPIVTHIDRSNDDKIIDIVRSIMSQGTMIVETPNEADLVVLMQRRGTPIENIQDPITAYGTSDLLRSGD